MRWVCKLVLLGCLSSPRAFMRNLLSLCPLANHNGKVYQSDTGITLFVMPPPEHLSKSQLNYVTYFNRFYCLDYQI